MDDRRWTVGREKDGRWKMTTHERWKMDAGKIERRSSKNDNPWTMEDGRWAERKTVAEE